MRRIAVAAVAVAALVAAGLSRPQTLTLVPAAHPRTDSPLLGIVSHRAANPGTAEVQRLVRLDPRSLRPIGARSVILGRNVTTWSFSPDRTLLAVAREHTVSDDAPPTAVVEVVDLHSFALVREISVGDGWATTVAWLAPDRAAVVQQRENGSVELTIVDPLAGLVVSRESLNGFVVHVARTASTLVVLMAPGSALAHPTLEIVDATGARRSVTLSQTLAGFVRPPNATPQIGQYRTPGLALDRVNGRAYVVGADEPVAEVDLASGAVAYHTPSRPVSLLGRLDGFVEPRAQAKTVAGTTRVAIWLGNGLLGVSGSEGSVYEDAQHQLQTRNDPTGVEIVDTRDWSVRTLDRRGDYLDHAGSDLIVTAHQWDSTWFEPKGIGLVVYGPAGELRYHRLGTRSVWVEYVYRGRAYVIDQNYPEAIVVRLSDGRIVGRRHVPLPAPLVGNPYE